MKKIPLFSTGSFLDSARWSMSASILVLIAMLGYGVHRFDVPMPAGSANNDAALIAKVRMHLNEISLSLATYMQNHESFSLDLVKEEGKLLTQDLDLLTQKLKGQGRTGEAQRLEKAHKGMRETSISLLIVDQESVVARKMADESRIAFEMAFDGKTARGRRPDLPRNVIDKFSRQTMESQQADARKIQTLSELNQWREMLERTLREVPKLQEVPRAAHKGLYVQGLLFLLAVATLIFPYRRLKKDLSQPLREMLSSVEAATAGDTSRLPQHAAHNELGQLAQAIGRLIQVVGRSENLVYHLAALVESSGDAIISHTLDGKILSWNKGAQRIYGYSAEEMKGQSIDALVIDPEKREMVQILQRLREGARVMPFETVHLARNGRHVRAFVRVAAIHDSTRQIIGASFIAQELSHAKAVHEKIADSPTL